MLCTGVWWSPCVSRLCHGRPRGAARRGAGVVWPATGTPTGRCSSGAGCSPTRGWACPTWPVEWYGRGLPAWADAVVRARSSRAPARSAPPVGGGMAWPRRRSWPTAPTTLKRQLLRPIAHRRGHVVPAVQRARRRLRPRRAHDARRARRRRVGRQRPEGVDHRAPTTPTSACCSPAPTGTCPSTAASRYFVLPMHQPGVEVRPLRQMNGHAVVQRGVPHRRARARRPT